MTRAENIAARLREVQQQVAEAEARAGRAPGSARLLAVSKKMPAADVRAALAAGQRDFGENYANELRDKRAELGGEAAWPPIPLEVPPSSGEAAAPSVTSGRTLAPRWHYIGPLQRNKAKILVGQVALIHSIADADLVDELERRAATASPSVHAGGADGGPLASTACLVQVNVAGETQKSGVAPRALPALLDRFAAAAHVHCVGLMVIPPLGPAAEDSRRHFAALRALAEQEDRVARPRVQLRELSMGMSGDFAVAIEEGATLVRVGTAIFGERAPA
jgi:pyridoxal phosphate enzyme (YggS family)